MADSKNSLGGKAMLDKKGARRGVCNEDEIRSVLGRDRAAPPESEGHGGRAVDDADRRQIACARSIDETKGVSVGVLACPDHHQLRPAAIEQIARRHVGIELVERRVQRSELARGCACGK
jgi:hypothetical protein